MLPLLSIICWTIATANGVLLLLSPIKYRTIIGWLWRVTEQPFDRARSSGHEWQQRLAGFVITVISLGVLWSIIHARLIAAQTRIDTNASWLDPVATIFLFAGGLSVLLYPNTVARWSARQFTEHLIPEETLLHWQVGARLLGAAAIVGAGLTIYFWTSRPA